MSSDRDCSEAVRDVESGNNSLCTARLIFGARFGDSGLTKPRHVLHPEVSSRFRRRLQS